jgi:hypothetical protein
MNSNKVNAINPEVSTRICDIVVGQRRNYEQFNSDFDAALTVMEDEKLPVSARLRLTR